MVSGSYESGLNSGEVPALYTLAEKLCDTPGGFDNYNYAKCVWLGNPDRSRRLDGEHPWPTRIHNQEPYVYSVPVMAGVDVAHETMLYIGKDNWKPVNDPNAWLVAERRLIGGREIEHRVLHASVDAAHDVRLTLAPASFDNFPPQMKRAIANRPAYAQSVLSGRLDAQYNLVRASLREGMDGSGGNFEDIEALESMIMMVQRLRYNQAEWERRRNQEASSLAIVGQQGILLDQLAA